MKHLKILNLANNAVSDLTPLSQLTDLQQLNLLNNPLMDVNPLKSLVKLEQLKISLSALVDSTPLQQLPALKGFFDYRLGLPLFNMRFRFPLSAF